MLRCWSGAGGSLSVFTGRWGFSHPKARGQSHGTTAPHTAALPGQGIPQCSLPAPHQHEDTARMAWQAFLRSLLQEGTKLNLLLLFLPSPSPNIPQHNLPFICFTYPFYGCGDWGNSYLLNRLRLNWPVAERRTTTAVLLFPNTFPFKPWMPSWLKRFFIY